MIQPKIVSSKPASSRYAPRIGGNRAARHAGPDCVRASSFLYGLCAAFSALMMYHGLLAAFTGDFDTAVAWSPSAVFFAAFLWIILSLNRGTRIVWHIQLALALAGVFLFPLGTIINVYILSEWFKPETKAHFGVS